MRARLSLLLVFVLLGTALAGCASNTTTPSPTPSGSPSASPTATAQPPATGGAITLGTTDTITSLDPGNAYEHLSINVLENTEGTLLVNKPDSAELVPELATAMPVISPDGLDYTFILKPGIKYADGTAIKASDFLWALERNSGKVGGQEGGPAFLIYDSPGVDLANSTADDTTGTLKIHLNQPGVFFNSLVIFPNFAPLPKSMYTKDAWREPTGTTANLPVSSGPYQLAEYRQGEFLTLTKNPNYAGPRVAKTDKITIKLYSTSSSMKSAVQNGEIDIAARSFTPDEYASLKSAGGSIQTKSIVGPSPLRFIGFNTNASNSVAVDSSKKAVRQAVAYILDRDQINQVVFGGTVTPAYSIVAAGLIGEKDSYKSIYGGSPNVQKAKDLLTAAGYSSSNKVTIPLWYNSDGHYGDTEADLATLIKKQLEDTGFFSVTLQTKPWAEYKKDFRGGNYPMFLIGWFPDYIDPDDYISPFLTPGGARSFGTFYVNDTMQPLIKSEQKDPVASTRIDTLGKLQDGAAEDNLMLPIFSGQQQVVYRSGLNGVTLSPTDIFPYYTLYK